MPSKLTTPQFSLKKPLVNNLLLIEGITRAGKLLAANIVNGFKDTEPTQALIVSDPIPFLHKFGLIDKQAAKVLLQLYVDLYAYDMFLGRNYNFRRSDKSSIFNMPNHKELLKRLDQSNLDAIIKKYHQSKSYSPYVIHEAMPFIHLYFEIFPKLKVISLKRSPLDLVYSQYQRGYATRWRTDTTIVSPTIKTKRGLVPWYTYQWKEDFYKLNEMDRVIRLVITLDSFYKQSYNKLPDRYKKKILFINYENILSSPGEVIKSIKKFIGKQPVPQMKKILSREKLPNHKRFTEKDKRIQLIKKLATPKYFNQLMKLEKKYYQDNKIFNN